MASWQLGNLTRLPVATLLSLKSGIAPVKLGRCLVRTLLELFLHLESVNGNLILKKDYKKLITMDNDTISIPKNHHGHVISPL